MNIILVGFMGTGKSTIAALLSQKTGRQVQELDSQIVRSEGISIPAIFERDGEEGFRNIETRELKKALAENNIILSGGGGVVLRAENRRFMKEHGLVICLEASPETIWQRVGGDEGRPNLKNRKSPEEIRELMESRREAYRDAAHLTVSTDGKTPEEVAEEIRKLAEANGQTFGE